MIERAFLVLIRARTTSFGFATAITWNELENLLVRQPAPVEVLPNGGQQQVATLLGPRLLMVLGPSIGPQSLGQRLRVLSDHGSCAHHQHRLLDRRSLLPFSRLKRASVSFQEHGSRFRTFLRPRQVHRHFVGVGCRIKEWLEILDVRLVNEDLAERQADPSQTALVSPAVPCILNAMHVRLRHVMGRLRTRICRRERACRDSCRTERFDRFGKVEAQLHALLLCHGSPD